MNEVAAGGIGNTRKAWLEFAGGMCFRRRYLKESDPIQWFGWGLVGVWLGFGWIQPQAVLVDSYAVTGVAVVTGMNSLGIVVELA